MSHDVGEAVRAREARKRSVLKTQEEQTSTDPVIVAVTTDQRSCARRLGTHSLLVLDTMLVAAFLVLGTAFSIVLMVFT